jgi:hypothetical protein
MTHDGGSNTPHETNGVTATSRDATRESFHWRRRLGIWGLFIALTAAMTWPMITVFATRSVDHFDILFNLWRLRWIHHALTTSPAQLFDGNQFYPERHVLSFSDAVLVEGVFAGPLLAIGLPPMLVHNLVLLGAMCASGIGMYALARHMSGREGASILAGVIFAFAPFRFGHIMHLEMQWAMWTPWAFLMLQRTVETGRLKFGLLTGVFAALQLMSSVYYGLFLSLMLAAVGGLLWLTAERPLRIPALRALVAGALIAGACAALYSRPYQSASDRVGKRSPDEVREWSAGFSSYRAVSENNRLYSSFLKGGDENCLFPGFVPPVLAIVALIAARPRRTTLIYAAGAALAIDLSLGLNGLIYPWLYKHAGVFGGLRAPARASIFFLLCLGVLAAKGAAIAIDRVPVRLRAFAASALVGLVLAEYWVAPLRLIGYPTQPPALYEYLRQKPDGIVAHFPMPVGFRMPGDEPKYLYGSTFHWKPIVNGYSGYYPPSYIARLRGVENFPMPQAIEFLRKEQVRYLVVHEAYYRDRLAPSFIVLSLQRMGLTAAARLHDGGGYAVVFELQ